EPFVVSGGVLAGGGVIAFVLGLLWVVDPGQTDLVLLPEVWIPLALGLSLGVALLAWAAARTRRLAAETLKRVGGGSEGGLGGYRGTVQTVTADGLRGKVLIRGEIWDFESSRAVRPGETVVGVHLDGVRVTVRPLDVKN